MSWEHCILPIDLKWEHLHMRSFCWGKTVWSQPLAKDGLQIEYLGLQLFYKYLYMFLRILKTSEIQIKQAFWTFDSIFLLYFIFSNSVVNLISLDFKYQSKHWIQIGLILKYSKSNLATLFHKKIDDLRHASTISN